MRRADYSRPDGLLSIEPFGESGPWKSQRRWVGWRLKAAPTAAGACGRRAPARSLRSRARAWRLRHHACLRGLRGPQALQPRGDAPGSGPRATVA